MHLTANRNQEKPLTFYYPKTYMLSKQNRFKDIRPIPKLQEPIIIKPQANLKQNICYPGMGDIITATPEEIAIHIAALYTRKSVLGKFHLHPNTCH